MEIIAALEDAPRGIYTGAIGFLAPNGDATFSVPIRTLALTSSTLQLGVGGGIVADSTAPDEYDECLLKASFLNAATTAPSLIETLLYDNAFPHLERHIARLTQTADQFAYPCDSLAIRNTLIALAATLTTPTRIRLLLHADGRTETHTSSVTGPTANLNIRLSSRRVLSTDSWLRHKTTRRAFYNRELARAQADGFDEVLFLNEHDELTEGSVSNLFLEINGRLHTPPLTDGVLPGVYRQHLLETHPNACESTLTLADLHLADAAYLVNAVRGLRSIARIQIE